MQKFTLLIETYAPSVLRIGMAIVILWFGTQQLLHAADWTAYVPDGAIAFAHVSAKTLVYFNAFFELILGLLLLFGWRTRIVAFLLALHLFDIMWIVGYGEIGVRDFGLAIATLVVSMNGADPLCYHQPKKKNLPSQPLSQPSIVQPKKLI